MRGPRFTDAQATFHALLDSHERGAERPFAYAHREAFESIADGDRFDRSVLAAEKAGFVAIGYGAGDRRHEIRRIRLADPAGLYRHLGRTPMASAVEKARLDILEGLDLQPAILEGASAVFAAWNRRSTWCSLAPEAGGEVRNALALAQAILDRRHEGLDYRTFSRRVVKDSKALERLETAVLRLVAGSVDLPSGLGPRSAFAAIGLERIGQPILLAGPVSLGRNGPENPTAYVGLPPSDIGHVGFVRGPEYVLTIENLVSFNRHVLEADPQRRGLTIYVGGYPSLGIQKALGQIASIVPDEVPFFHWSDIDPDGIMIHRTVERALGRACRPHLMSIDLAERHGTTIGPAGRLRKTLKNDDALALLEAYLRKPDAKTLEQEEIDPEIPQAHMTNLQSANTEANLQIDHASKPVNRTS